MIELLLFFLPLTGSAIVVGLVSYVFSFMNIIVDFIACCVVVFAGAVGWTQTRAHGGWQSLYVVRVRILIIGNVERTSLSQRAG